MSDDIPVQDITIYHKNGTSWDRYVKEASFRNTSVINRNKNGTNSTEKALVRIFDIKEYNLSWFVENEDIIVNKEVDDEITGTPLTILKEKYGKDNVFKVTSTDKLILDDEDLKELEHIKLGCI